MNWCMMNPGQVDKVVEVQRRVDDVKNVMVQNIEQVLARGEKIEDLVDKTDQLRFQAEVRTGPACSLLRWVTGRSLQGLGSPWVLSHTLCRVRDPHRMCFPPQSFQKQSQSVRRSLAWQNMKMKLIVISLILVVLLIIILVACNSLGCW